MEVLFRAPRMFQYFISEEKKLITVGKVLTITDILLKINYVDVLQYLQATFPSTDQIYLMPDVNGQDLPLSFMSIHQFEAVVLRKQSNKVRAIISGDLRLEFDVLKAYFISAEDDENLR